MDYSVVIATLERPSSLRRVLKCLSSQTRLPHKVVVVDASDDDESSRVVDEYRDLLLVVYLSSFEKSSAKQRNMGAKEVFTDLIAFVDDDVEFGVDTFELLCDFFQKNGLSVVGGVSPMIEGDSHRVPGWLLRNYYRIQSGYDDLHYGARFFGAAITTYPCLSEQKSSFISSEWLPSTFVIFSRSLFEKTRFPEFQGYSPGEDVYCSAHIRQFAPLYFARNVVIEHHPSSSSMKENAFLLQKMKMSNQRIVARKFIPDSWIVRECKFFLHKFFISMYILRSTRRKRLSSLLGVWLG